MLVSGLTGTSYPVISKYKKYLLDPHKKHGPIGKILNKYNVIQEKEMEIRINHTRTEWERGGRII